MLPLIRAGLLTVAVVTCPTMSPPVVAPGPVIDRGTSPAGVPYMQQEAAYANGILAALGSGRERLRAAVTRFIDAGPSITKVVRTNLAVFYLERPAGTNDARLMIRPDRGAPRLLLDPDALRKRLGSVAHLSIAKIVPSADGTHVAVGLIPGGAEIATHTRIIETATGALLPDDLPRTWRGSTAWSLDGTTLFYNQTPSVAPGHETQRERRSIVYRHELGSTAPDPAVFGIGLDPNVPFQPSDSPIVEIPAGSNYAIGRIEHQGRDAFSLYAAPVASVLAGGQIPWRLIAGVEDGVISYDVHDNTAYLVARAGASPRDVIALDLSDANASAANPTTIVAVGAGIIEGVAVAADALYVRGINPDVGVVELRKLPWRADGGVGALADVRLPFGVSLEAFATDSRVDGAIIGLGNGMKPLLVDALDPRGGLTDAGLPSASRIDATSYTTLDVRVSSSAGASVPVSIFMKRGLRLDGSNPTYLEVQSALGRGAGPDFLGPRFAWLDAGGIWAVATVRGGESGPAVDDALAVARYLIEQKYTAPAHLAIAGTDAGGRIVGAAITQQPELFAAALDVAGGTGAADADSQIVDGRRYPAVLGVAGMNDSRVAPWREAAFVARLRRASASGRPVILRVDDDAGYDLLAASRAQTIARFADEFSFLLWQCGSPDFAAVPSAPISPAGH